MTDHQEVNELGVDQLKTSPCGEKEVAIGYDIPAART